MAPPRMRWKTVVPAVLGLAFVAAIFFVVLPRIANYGDVWDAARGLAWWWWIILAGAALLNLVTFGPMMMAALPGLSYRSALAASTASNASTYVAPGGAAVGAGFLFAMLRGWGFRGKTATLAVALTSIWNQFMTFGSPSVAVLLLSIEGGESRTLSSMAWVGFGLFAGIVGAFALALSSDAQARWLGDAVASATSRVLRMLRRGAANFSGASFVRFRHDAIGLLRKRWHVLTLSTLAGHLTVYLVLILTLRAVGVSAGEVTIIESFAAWSLVRVLQALPIVPGGFGIVELGLTTALAGFGGNNAEVVAAVLLYRALTVVPPLVAGALFAATWRRHNPHWREETAQA